MYVFVHILQKNEEKDKGAMMGFYIFTKTKRDRIIYSVALLIHTEHGEAKLMYMLTTGASMQMMGHQG